jgi:tetratricopeptide (TPR) repeat protein
VKAELYKYLEGRAPRKKENGKYVVDTSPKHSDELMKKVLTDFKVDDYSSAMLASIGDHYMKEKDYEGAANCFNRLLLLFPKSLFLDWAAVGLGDIAMAAKEPDYATALKKYTLATDEYPGSKFGEAVLGKARVQYFTDKLEEAEKALKGVLGDKSYPPESKAEAQWLLGEIKFKQKALPDAYNDFQRLYLSFKKFPDWSCKGYLRAGETKEALGKFEDAKAVYREAIDDPKNAEKFKGQPDFEKIKANYRKLN